jgi:hypothetical protein
LSNAEKVISADKAIQHVTGDAVGEKTYLLQTAYTFASAGVKNATRTLVEHCHHLGTTAYFGYVPRRSSAIEYFCDVGGIGVTNVKLSLFVSMVFFAQMRGSQSLELAFYPNF